MKPQSDRGEIRAVLGVGRLARLQALALQNEVTEQEMLRRLIDTLLPPDQLSFASIVTPDRHQIATGEIIEGEKLLAFGRGEACREGERVLDTVVKPTSLPSILPTTVDNSPVRPAQPGPGQAEHRGEGAERESEGYNPPGKSARPSAQRVEAPHSQDDATHSSAVERPPLKRKDLGSNPSGSTSSAQPRPAAKSRGSRPTIGPRFEAFWAAWPSGPRKHRQPAEKAFLALETSGRLPPVSDGVDLLIAALEADRKTWNPGFDPMPSTWLNQERYRTALLDLGWSFKARPGGGGVMPGWRWAREVGASPAPATPTTPSRPAWAVDYTAARSRGDIGGRLRGLLMDAYPGWPIRHAADPELSRVEAIWSKFEGSQDIDEILSLRPAIEAEIAKLEARDGPPEGSSGQRRGRGVLGNDRGVASPPVAQPSLWRDAPS